MLAVGSTNCVKAVMSAGKRFLAWSQQQLVLPARYWISLYHGRKACLNVKEHATMLLASRAVDLYCCSRTKVAESSVVENIPVASQGASPASPIKAHVLSGKSF